MNAPRARPPRWKRYVWLAASVVFAINGLLYAFDNDSGSWPWPVEVGMAIALFAVAVGFLRNFLVANRRSRDER